MRKVKFTQQVWHEKLSKLLEEFPRVDDIHPFYSDLLNVLYDKDHYKLALGQINTARNLIDKLAKDYVKLLKYGDSLYRCKQLKRAALGRMCTLMKKHTASLAYLEQVRQHMARLPSIDPATRTILICGYPNVGKSSFMNRVTRADVEVQPYAFTTKSLFVGHTDYNYLRWQVIDTPGILDRPLEERNTIEMQSITALAHLRCVVLYVMDISEQCGYSIKQQAALFDSIKPLFMNKPLVVAFNKIDARSLDDLAPEDKALIQELNAVSCPNQPDAPLLSMSTLHEEGVSVVKQACCDRLLAVRVEQKLRGKRVNDVLNRIYVAQPQGGAERPPVLPSGLAELRSKRAAGERRKTEKDMQEENGGAGVYRADVCKTYMLKDESWKHDIVPEILDGKNVFDFIDPDIEQRLLELEAEEEAREAAAEEEMGDAGEDLTEEEAAALAELRKRKARLIASHRREKSVKNNQSVVPRKFDRDGRSTTRNMRDKLASVGLDASAAIERARGRSSSRLGRGLKRGRSASAAAGAAGDASMGDAETPPAKRVHTNRSRSLSRGASAAAAEITPGSGFKDKVQKNKAQKLADKSQYIRNKFAKAGEADRVIQTKMPKHLFSGKRGNGKTDRR